MDRRAEYLATRLVENMRNSQHRRCRIGKVRFKKKILPAILGDLESVRVLTPWWMQLPAQNKPIVVT